LYLKRSWSDFDPQAYSLYGEDQNHETSFKDKALQAAVDSWCKIQVIIASAVGCQKSVAANSGNNCSDYIHILSPAMVNSFQHSLPEVLELWHIAKRP
jgi:hypothetical protein